jgi:hypothetical protein
MHYRAIVVLMFAMAVGTLLVMFPGRVFRSPAQMLAERNLLESDHDAQMKELRQLAHSAMLRLQSRHQAPSYIHISGNNWSLAFAR